MWINGSNSSGIGFTQLTRKDQRDMLLCSLHTWLLLHLSCALLSRCHMTEQCREQQSVGYIFSSHWWQSEGGAQSQSYIRLCSPEVPLAFHAFKNNWYHFGSGGTGPGLVSEQYRIFEISHWLTELRQWHSCCGWGGGKRVRPRSKHSTTTWTAAAASQTSSVPPNHFHSHMIQSSQSGNGVGAK